MKRGSRLVALTLVAMLIGISISGCGTAESKKDSDISGLIPYVADGFNKDYLPQSPNDGKGNLLKYEF